MSSSHVVVFLSILGYAHGGNPLVPGVGMADPNIRLMNGTFFVWATHDFSVNNTAFEMRDWWVWSSPDLVAWTLQSRVVPTEVLLWDDVATECWATDAALRHGKYYFYLSVGPASIGVVSADSPSGPWTDPLGRPLLDDALAKSLQPPTTFRDPAVFEDDDGRWYLIAGVFEYYIVELSADMVSVASAPRHVEVVGAYGACGANRTDDKPFLHKRKGLYYLSWGCFYGTAASLFGPYITVGSVIDTARIAPDFRIGGAKEPWYTAEDYTDRHGSFLQAHGQWYFATNDRSHSGDAGHEGYFRDTVMGYIHFRANGSMQPMEIDGAGVGSHDARRWIEAERFFSGSDGVDQSVDLRAEGGGEGFAAGNLSNGSVLIYRNVAHLLELGSSPTLIFRTAAPTLRGAAALAVTIRVSDDVAGRCIIPPTSSWASFADVPCPLTLRSPRRSPPEGPVTLTLTITLAGGATVGASHELMRLDRFVFISNATP